MPHSIIFDIDTVKSIRPDWPDELCASLLEEHHIHIENMVLNYIEEAVEFAEIIARDARMRRIHEQRQAAERHEREQQEQHEAANQHPYGFVDIPAA